MASSCICKEHEYFCIGCYSTYISRYSDERKTCCCWGLGYLWETKPLTRSAGTQRVGAGCFTGIACLFFGNDAGKYYFHEHTKNIYKTFSIYFPCGIFSSVDDSYMSEIELKTPCCGCKRHPEPRQLAHSISGAEKNSSTVVPITKSS